MAVITTTVDATLEPFSFSGYQDVRDRNRNTARAQIFAFVRNGAIALTGAGDNQFFVLRTDLPVNFGYALVDYCFSVTSAAAGTVNFANDVALNWFNATTAANRTMDVPLGMVSSGAANMNSTNNESKFYKLVCPYNGIVQGRSGESCRLQLEMFNETANDAAYTFDLAARFIQYDIEQLNNSDVNTPQLARS